jgi:hypothetical protein
MAQHFACRFHTYPIRKQYSCSKCMPGDVHGHGFGDFTDISQFLQICIELLIAFHGQQFVFYCYTIRMISILFYNLHRLIEQWYIGHIVIFLPGSVYPFTAIDTGTNMIWSKIGSIFICIPGITAENKQSLTSWSLITLISLSTILCSSSAVRYSRLVSLTGHLYDQTKHFYLTIRI